MDFTAEKIYLTSNEAEVTHLPDEFSWAEASGACIKLYERMRIERDALTELQHAEVPVRSWVVPSRSRDCEVMRRVWHGIIKNSEGKLQDTLEVEAQEYLKTGRLAKSK